MKINGGLFIAITIMLLAACSSGAPFSIDPSANVDSGGAGDAVSTVDAASSVDTAATDAASSVETGSPSIEGGPSDVASSDSADPDLVQDAAPEAEGGSDVRPCSASVDIDSENCGACGHSCLGGVCQAGLCATIELASKQIALSGLTVGSGAVFWTSEGASPDYIGSVFALSLSDPTAMPTLLATNQKYPRALTFADGALYWGSYGDGAIGKWTATTGTADLGAASGRLYNVVVGSVYVYFAMEIDHADMPPSGAVARCPLQGCGGTPMEILATSNAKIVGLAIDGSSLFWSVFSNNGAIYRLTLDGSSPPVAISVGQASPLDITAFGGFIYWVNGGSGTVASMSADAVGVTPTILASNQPSPGGIAADDRGIYWTTNTRTGQVMKLAHGTSIPLVLASGQPSPGHVRTDADYVYWTNTGDGSIRRVPK